MKKSRIQIFLTILFLTVLLFNSALADEKIKLHLHQPPPNKLGIGDMWNLELDNTSGKDMEIYLTGTATEEKDGLIVEGRSKAFTIRPGKTNYSYKDFSNAEVKYNNGRYKEIILRTGNVPEGNYTICVTAFEKSGEIAGQENCIMQKVEIKSEAQINLVSPSDGEEIGPDQPITFMWTGFQGNEGYNLPIYEVKGEVSNDDIVFKESPPFFERKGISSTSFLYPVTAPKFTAGKKYAWRITSGDTKSDIWTFTVPQPITPAPVTGNCCGGFVKEIKSITAENELVVTMKAGLKPIKKVTMSLVYLRSVTDPNCPVCKSSSIMWGNFAVAWSNLGGFGNIAAASNMVSRELTWTNNTGVNMIDSPRVANVYLTLDPVSAQEFYALAKCCKTDIEYCIRYSFTDTSCVTCDTVICSNTSIRGDNQQYMDDSSRQNNKKIQEELKNQFEEPKIQEQNKSNDGEGQGNSLLMNPISTIGTKEETRRIDNVSNGSVNNGLKWYFGGHAGLQWDHNSPTDLPTPLICNATNCPLNTYEGSAVITDDQGNIRFYTDGKTIWDANNTPMTNGQNLLGNSSATQSALIVPWPDGKCNKYYVFTVPAAEVNAGDGLRYSVVDMSKNNGKGDVLIDYKDKLLKSDVCEKLTAIAKNPPSSGYWVIAHGFGTTDGSKFYVYDINSNSPTNPLNAIPIESSFGTINTGGGTNPGTGKGNMQGQMKVSPDGKKIALAVTYAGFVEVFSFNNSNGKVTACTLSLTGLGTDHGEPYGVEFSPSGQYLFFSTTMTTAGMTYLYRIDLDLIGPGPFSGYPNSTVNGAKLLKDAHTSTGTIFQRSYFGALQLGPDNKIYVAMVNKSKLSVIKNPDDPISNYVDEYQNIAGTCYWGLPTVIQGNFSCSTPVVPKDCCKGFNINVTTPDISSSTNSIAFTVTAGPRKIKRVIAEIINFSVSYNDQVKPDGTTNCSSCNNNSDNWGNFYLPNSAGDLFGLPGKLTVPDGSSSQYGREIVWGSMNGAGVDMTGPSRFLNVEISLPLKSPSSCCADTIKMCVRYKFTDVNCITCDKVVCYTIVRSPGIGMIDNNNGGNNVTELQDVNQSSVGQSAGIVNIDIPAASKVKVTIYDAKGNELMKVYDDYMNKGQYAFDLSAYNLPDGVYYYKSEYSEKTEYNKILVTKPVSGCNCGH